MANKIKYGLSNVYIAAATIDSQGAATYDTPVALPGACSLSLEPQGENSPFYADNIVYYMVATNTGYQGDLEVALIPDTIRKTLWGELEDDNHLLVEDADAQLGHFALLFQFEGDDSATRHVLYNCTAARPSVASQTKEDTTTPVTETMTITASSVKFDGQNIVKAKTTANTSTADYNAWFSAVTAPDFGSSSSS